MLLGARRLCCGSWPMKTSRTRPCKRTSYKLFTRCLQNLLIEPAEPEPPPAHSLGRVDEDIMGRSGQLVRPRSLDAGGVAGGRNWWRGWWLGLFFHRFFLHFWSPWARKIDQNCSKSQNRRKNRKITKKLPKTDQRLFDLGSPNGLEIHQKCRKNGSKKSVKKITLQNTAVLAQGCIFRRKTLRFRGISG